MDPALVPSRRRARAMFAATALAALVWSSPANGSPQAPEVRIEWPEDSPAAEALSALGPPPSPLAVASPAWPEHGDPQAFEAPGAWMRWAEALSESGATPEARRSAASAALLQGRWDSAWSHLTSLASVDPEAARALLPRFLPGVTGPARIAADGGLEPLPAGVRLAPALPPPTRSTGRFDLRSVRVRGLQIGDGTLDLTMGVRGDGVEFRLEHVAGGPIELELLVPVPGGSEVVGLYADWRAQDDPQAPVSIRIEPGGEPYRVWIRTKGALLEWPGLAVDAFDARLGTAGLQLLFAADDPWAAELADLARGLALALGIPVTTADRAAPVAHTPLAPVRIDVPPVEARAVWLKEFIDDVERFVLARRVEPR